MSENPSATGPQHSSGKLDIAGFFDAMQDAQMQNTADIARLAAELENAKNLLALHGSNIEDTIRNAQELFDLRTAMVLHDNDAMKNQFREVSAVFQRSIEQLNQTIDSRLIIMEGRVNSIKQADVAVASAKITRTQYIVGALLVFAGVVVTSLTTVLLTLAQHGVK